ncbi:hypothetical protein ACFL5F_01590 [Planctomycetota bacterium]
MNTQKRIERCLRAAPKPPAQDRLLDKLQKDVALGEIKTRRSALQRLFVPTGGPISLRRIAMAASIAIVILLPLSYGAVKVMKYFTVFEAKFDYPEDNTVYSVGVSIGSNSAHGIEEAIEKQKEFYQLYKEGKAEENEPGLWIATLSDGEEFAYSGDPDVLGLSETDRIEVLKKRFDEIHELRKAGKYERTFIKEIEKNGKRIRLYRDTFTLSNGKAMTMTSGIEQKQQE